MIQRDYRGVGVGLCLGTSGAMIALVRSQPLRLIALAEVGWPYGLWHHPGQESRPATVARQMLARARRRFGLPRWSPVSVVIGPSLAIFTPEEVLTRSAWLLAQAGLSQGRVAAPDLAKTLRPELTIPVGALGAAAANEDASLAIGAAIATLGLHPASAATPVEVPAPIPADTLVLAAVPPAPKPATPPDTPPVMPPVMVPAPTPTPAMSPVMVPAPPLAAIPTPRPVTAPAPPPTAPPPAQVVIPAPIPLPPAPTPVAAPAETVAPAPNPAAAPTPAQSVAPAPKPAAAPAPPRPGFAPLQKPPVVPNPRPAVATPVAPGVWALTVPVAEPPPPAAGSEPGPSRQQGNGDVDGRW